MHTFLRSLAAFAFSALVLAACGGEPSSSAPAAGAIAANTDAPDTSAAVPARALEIEDFAYARHADGARVVTGTLYNASSRRVSGAMVSVALYDADNRRIGTLRVPVQDVPPGERRAFRQIVDRDGVQGARVHSVLVL